jgi:hypothetical protein
MASSLRLRLRIGRAPSLSICAGGFDAHVLVGGLEVKL